MRIDGPDLIHVWGLERGWSENLSFLSVLISLSPLSGAVYTQLNWELPIPACIIQSSHFRVDVVLAASVLL